MVNITKFSNQARSINSKFYATNKRVDGWNDGEQHQTFLNLLRIEDYARIPFQNATVLDVGCGTGDLSRYLGLNMIRNYTGIDIYEPAIIEAQKKYPSHQFPNRHFLIEDILEQKSLKKYDFVFASGALSMNLSQAGIDNYVFAESMIEAMWNMTLYGLVFNVLTADTPNQGDQLFFYDKNRLEKIVAKLAPRANRKIIDTPFTYYGQGKTGEHWIGNSHFYLSTQPEKRI